MIHDVIIVGAGPGGSSAAAFLARRGVSTLVLDRAMFPRDKVCGDGLTPQAIYWLDQLGCVEEVLAETKGCLKDCDLFINGERLLTGGFPSSGSPSFRSHPLAARHSFGRAVSGRADGSKSRLAAWLGHR
jgi:2-polyprenyl-6-methoxyphenol hydroxylase-like FAD-dependent oxidoreductase